MYAVDLFSGAGGLSHGMMAAGVEFVVANEIESDFARTYALNHVNTHVLNNDIYQVNFASLIHELGYAGKIDIVCGGPPCQGFSTIGKKDFMDPRNSLFGQYIRVVDELQPSIVLFENVSGFRRLYGGVVYFRLVEALEERGYLLNTGILNAINYGLPQNRLRTIVVGSRDVSKPIEFPPITHGFESDVFKSVKPALTLLDAISDLPPLSVGEEASSYLVNPVNDYQYKLRGREDKLTEHSCARYGQKMQKILSLIPSGGSVYDLPEELRPKSFFGNTYARLLPNVPAPTMTRNFGTPSSSRCVHPFQNRALSTREGARIQGFPDGYKFYGSKTSKNLQIGNAVPPLLGEVIGRAIINSIV